jgi:hypothetical protein
MLIRKNPTLTRFRDYCLDQPNLVGSMSDLPYSTNEDDDFESGSVRLVYDAGDLP